MWVQEILPVFLYSFGQSKSHSVIDWCLNTILLKCLPPLTFHVATPILNLEVEVNSSFLLQSDSNNGGGTIKI